MQSVQQIRRVSESSRSVPIVAAFLVIQASPQAGHGCDLLSNLLPDGSGK